MALNNNGNLLDDAGNVAVDFVWGNFPLQPNDQRPDTATGRLNYALDNHVIAQVGWNGYPGYEPNTDGSAVDSDSPADGIQADEIFLKVPTVIGLTTALATDALKDAGFATVTTNATLASNAAGSITDIDRTAGSTTVELTGTGFVAAYPVGTKITVASTGTVDGTWTVTGTTSTNKIRFTSNASTVLTSGTGSIIGVVGTIKSVTYGSGTAANQTTASTVTVTPYDVAS